MQLKTIEQKIKQLKLQLPVFYYVSSFLPPMLLYTIIYLNDYLYIPILIYLTYVAIQLS